MAWSLAQSNSNAGSSATTRAVTFGSNVSSGSLLVACVWWNSDTDDVTSVADSLGQTFVRAIIATSSAIGERCAIYYKHNSASGACTVTLTTSVARASVIDVFEFTGGITTDPIDKTVAAASAGGSADPSANLTSVAANALAVGALVMDSVATAGANYTIGFNNTNWFKEASEYDLDVGSGGTVAVNFTAASNPWSLCGASFKSTSGGGFSGVGPLVRPF